MGRPKVDLEDFSEMLHFESEPEQTRAPGGAICGQSGIVEMDFAKMEPFPDHKFRLYEGQQLADMVESIRQFGILLPLILWHTQQGKYIILSGHNRRNAAKIAGLTKGPVIIRENLAHEEAVLIVTETNLRQRSFGDMRHSERAYCLAQHYEAMKCQGKRSDLLEELERLLNPHAPKVAETSAEVQHRFRSREKIGQEYGLSRDKVAKYIRISKLIKPLMEKVDTEEIAFLSAYTLSFIEDTDRQIKIAGFIDSNNYKVDMKKAGLLRSYYEAGKLTDTAVVQILSGGKTGGPKNGKPQPFKLRSGVITKYFNDGQNAREIEETIDKALKFYFEHQRGK